MTLWICATCGVEHADTPQPLAECIICSDHRQWVPRDGQHWTTASEFRDGGIRVRLSEVEPNLIGITSEPNVGIGQQTMLVVTPAGNLLFDPIGYVDEDAAARVLEYGPVIAVAASHPHMYGAQVSWSHALGNAPVYVNEADAEWVRREDPVIRLFSGTLELAPGLALHTLGGHFPGSTAALWDAGADGKGILLAGDAIFPNPNGTSVSFMRSYPNLLPLSAAVVDRVATKALGLRFDRLFNNFGRGVPEDAHAVVRTSADLYIEWVRGDHDDLT
ncbi:MBL fold metallo-hydrolase [Planctomonas sp. JC2975]|uniref:MBL fold metallo-hydrolase n=1 Tax=Planctomonas sp. JC2975 TaxID=2729626 RepID=UPI0014751FF1|nr:MBL fold metallo-hydrolase [Planctomonas sp. JC2975]NNC12161.1 MBL fold metallo-hydrolase [Planctomonas sp. JC2975]